MSYVAGAVAYLILHLLVYSIWLRRTQAFSHERVILLFHVISAVAVATAVILARLLDLASMTTSLAVAIICLHGIYSLSFLELWALADGGYSLGILRRVREGNSTHSTVRALRQLGDTKREARMNDLVRIGLIAQGRAGFELTGLGQVVATTMCLIQRVSNLRDVG